MKKTIERTALVVALLASLSAVPASASVAYLVTVDTSTVSGTSGFLDFQFNPGNATSQPATARIINFSGGAPGMVVPPVSGNVTGMLPGTVTIINSTAFNDLFQAFTYGTKFSFVVVLSGPAVDAPNGTSTAGSTFGVGLYDGTPTPTLTNQGAVTGFAGQIDIQPGSGAVTTTAFPNAVGGPSVVTFTPTLLSGDAFQIRYAANLNAGDSFVNITNSGAVSGSDPAGNICVNVYGFDPSEEMISCCSCLVSPNGLKSLSAQNDLLANTLTPGVPSAMVIKLLANRPLDANGNLLPCDPASPTSNNLAPGLRAWGSTLHALPGAKTTYGTTETPFSIVELESNELTKLTQFCGVINTNGSGFGICKSCRVGGLGAGTKP